LKTRARHHARQLASHRGAARNNNGGARTIFRTVSGFNAEGPGSVSPSTSRRSPATWLGPDRHSAAGTRPTSPSANACASGLNGLGEAWRYIRDGTCDVVLAGGTDALIDGPRSPASPTRAPSPFATMIPSAPVVRSIATATASCCRRGRRSRWSSRCRTPRPAARASTRDRRLRDRSEAFHIAAPLPTVSGSRPACRRRSKVPVSRPTPSTT